MEVSEKPSQQYRAYKCGCVLGKTWCEEAQRLWDALQAAQVAYRASKGKVDPYGVITRDLNAANAAYVAHFRGQE